MCTGGSSYTQKPKINLSQRESYMDAELSARTFFMSESGLKSCSCTVHWEKLTSGACELRMSDQLAHRSDHSPIEVWSDHSPIVPRIKHVCHNHTAYRRQPCLRTRCSVMLLEKTSFLNTRLTFERSLSRIPCSDCPRIRKKEMVSWFFPCFHIWS